jgi:hypothetical protein
MSTKLNTNFNAIELAHDDLNTVVGGYGTNNKYFYSQLSKNGKYYILYNTYNPRTLDSMNKFSLKYHGKPTVFAPKP